MQAIQPGHTIMFAKKSELFLKGGENNNNIPHNELGYDETIHEIQQFIE